ncbi:MAG: hypothetical protein STSR0009_02430 [Methanoregula sp.]
MVDFGCGTLPPPGWLGWGVPVFFFSRGTPHPPPAIWLEGIPPSKVPKVAPPSRFPARVYVGDTIQFIAQKGDREGGPPLCQVSKTPTPQSLQWEADPLWVGVGGGGYGFVPPASCVLVDVVIEEKTRAHFADNRTPAWIRKSAAKGISFEDLQKNTPHY